MTDERPPTHHRQDGKQAEVELAAERSLGAVVQNPGGFAQCRLRALDVISVEPLRSRGVNGQVLGIFALRVDGRHGDRWRVGRSKYTMAGKSKLRSRLFGCAPYRLFSSRIYAPYIGTTGIVQLERGLKVWRTNRGDKEGDYLKRRAWGLGWPILPLHWARKAFCIVMGLKIPAVLR